MTIVADRPLEEVVPDPEILLHPYVVTTDPRYVSLTPQYKEIIRHIAHVVLAQKPLFILEAPIGCGKSSVARFSEGWCAAKFGGSVKIAYIAEPRFTTRLQFSRAICEALGIPKKMGGQDEQENALRDFLVEQNKLGKRTVLIVDDAHKLIGPCWEIIHSLFNYHHINEKGDTVFLMQVLLFGEKRPLSAKLAQKPAIVDRASYIMKIEPLSLEETAEILADRARLVKWREDMWQPDAVKRLWEVSAGRARLVVKLAGIILEMIGRVPDAITASHVQDAMLKFPRFSDE